MNELRYALFEIPDALSELIQVIKHVLIYYKTLIVIKKIKYNNNWNSIFQCSIALERLRKFFITENMDSSMIGNIPDKGNFLNQVKYFLYLLYNIFNFDIEKFEM